MPIMMIMRWNLWYVTTLIGLGDQLTLARLLSYGQSFPPDMEVYNHDPFIMTSARL